MKKIIFKFFSILTVFILFGSSTLSGVDIKASSDFELIETSENIENSTENINENEQNTEVNTEENIEIVNEENIEIKNEKSNIVSTEEQQIQVDEKKEITNSDFGLGELPSNMTIEEGQISFKTEEINKRSAKSNTVSSQNVRWSLIYKGTNNIRTTGPIFVVKDGVTGYVSNITYCFDADNGNYVENNIIAEFQEHPLQDLNQIVQNGYDISSILLNTYPSDKSGVLEPIRNEYNNAFGGNTGDLLVMALSQYAIWEVRHNYESQHVNDSGWRNVVNTLKTTRHTIYNPTFTASYNGISINDTGTQSFPLSSTDSSIGAIQSNSNDLKYDVSVNGSWKATYGTGVKNTTITKVPGTMSYNVLLKTEQKEAATIAVWSGGGGYQDVIHLRVKTFSFEKKFKVQEQYASLEINKRMLDFSNKDITSGFTKWSDLSFKLSSTKAGYSQTITASSKTINFDSLVPSDDYKLVELTTNTEFVLDGTTNNLTLASGENKKITIDNKQKPSSLIFNKKMFNYNGTDITTSFNKWSDLEFELYNTKLGYSKVFTLTNLGTITINNLQADTEYYVKELKTGTEFVLNATPMKASLTPGKTTTITMNNNQKQSEIQFSKNMLNSYGVNLNHVFNKWSNLEFELYNTSLGYSKVFKLDNTGKALLSGLQSDPNYYIKELKTDNDFVLNTTPIKVSLNPGDVKSVTMDNKQKTAAITFEKIIKDTLGNDITKQFNDWENIEFELYNTDLQYSEDFTLDSTATKTFPTLQADSNYYIKEKSTDKKLVLNTTPIKVELSPGEIEIVKMDNIEKTGSLKLLKEMITFDGKKQITDFTNWNDLTFELRNDVIGYSSVFMLTSKEHVITGLQADDNYYIKELTTNDNFYLKTDSIKINIVQGEETNISIENKQKPGKILFNKEFFTSTGIDITEYFKNVQDVKFVLYNKQLGYNTTFALNANHSKLFENLQPSDDYYIKEIKTAFGYILNDEEIQLKVYPDKTTQASLINERSFTKVLLTKKTNKGTLREGAVYQLFKDKKATILLGEATSDINGIITFDNIEIINNIVYAKEKVAPTGTYLSDEIIPVKLNEINNSITAKEGINIQKEDVKYIGKKLAHYNNGEVKPLTNIEFDIIEINSNQKVGTIITSENGDIETPVLKLVDEKENRYRYKLIEKVPNSFDPIPDIYLNSQSFINIDGYEERIMNDVINKEKVYSLVGKKVAELNSKNIVADGTIFELLNDKKEIIATSTSTNEKGEFFFNELTPSITTENMTYREKSTSDRLILDQQEFSIKNIDFNTLTTGDIIELDSYKEPIINNVRRASFSKVDRTENDILLSNTDITIYEVVSEEVEGSEKITINGIEHIVVVFEQITTTKEKIELEGFKKDGVYIVKENKSSIGYHINNESYYSFLYEDKNIEKLENKESEKELNENVIIDFGYDNEDENIVLSNDYSELTYKKIDNSPEEGLINGAEIEILVDEVPDFIFNELKSLDNKKDLEEMYSDNLIEDKRTKQLMINIYDLVQEKENDFIYNDETKTYKLKEPKVVYDFKTEGKEVSFKWLPQKLKLIFHEKKAPTGYELASDIAYETTTEKNQEVKQVDNKIIIELAKTGESIDVTIIASIIAISLGLSILIVIIKNKKRKRLTNK